MKLGLNYFALFSLIFCITFLSLNSNGQEDNEGKIRMIDFHLQRNFMVPNNIPGVGLIVIKNDTVYLSKGYGYQNLEKLEPVDPNSLFSIGSVSKSFAGVISANILYNYFPHLEEIALEKPIIELIPQDSLEDAVLSDRFRTETISFRDLFSHRNCIDNEMIGATVGSFTSVEDVVRRMRYAKELCPFRQFTVYNNLMYTFGTHFIGKIGNSDYKTLLQNFLNDLGMDDTTYSQDDIDYDTLDNLADAYYLNGGTGQLGKFNRNLIKRVAYQTGAGGMLSSPNDMGKYIRFLLNKGKIDDVQVVPEHVLKWVTNPAIVYGNMNYLKNGSSNVLEGTLHYGLGLHTGVYRDETTIGHNGYFSGYAGKLTLFSESGIGIYSVSNGPSSFDHSDLHYAIYDIIMEKYTNSGNPLQTSNLMTDFGLNINLQKNKSSEYFEKMFVYSGENISIYEQVGMYENDYQGFAEVSLDENDQLYFKFGEWGTGPLFQMPGNPNLFEMKWDSDIIHDLYASPGFIPQVWCNFIDESTMIVSDGQSTFQFIKNAEFPDKIWHPDSCAPVYQ